jgi:hypothetical protein
MRFMAIGHGNCSLMSLMNTSNRIQAASTEHPSIPPLRHSQPSPPTSQQAECECPELCQIDHDN